MRMMERILNALGMNKMSKEERVLLQLLQEKGDMEFLNLYSPEELMKKYDRNLTLFDYLFEKGFMKERSFIECNNIKFLKFLRNRGLYEYLADFKEELLLTKFDGDKTVLEEIVSEGHKIKSLIKQKESIRILYRMNALSLITNIRTDMLFSSFKKIVEDESLEEQNLLEYILNNTSALETLLLTSATTIIEKSTILELLMAYWKKSKITPKIFMNYLKKVNVNKENPKLLVEFYLILAKNDLLKYVDKLSEETLLRDCDGKPLLKLLLDADKELTLKSLPEDVKSNPKIAAILLLMQKGENDRFIKTFKEIRIPLKDDDINNYSSNGANGLVIGPLSEEAEDLLQQLYELFINDGESDHELVSLLVNGYRNALFFFYDLNIQELKNLINIKQKNYQDFCYIKITDLSKEASFHSKGTVYCDRLSMRTVMHETGHALHFYLDGNRMPEQYEVVRERARSICEANSFMNEFLEFSRQKREEILSKATSDCGELCKSWYTETKKKEIQEYLKNYKEKIIPELEQLNIQKTLIDAMSELSFTIDQYVEHQIEVHLKEICSDLFEKEYCVTICFSDILDAIYSGELFDGKIKDKDGKEIHLSGHGSNYFSSPENCFKEMVADFGVIIKSSNAIESLGYLKELIGDELYDMLSNYYYENISKLKESEFGSIRGGKR